MEKKYIAHINEELKTKQTVKEHSENVAMLAEEYAVERFKKIAYVTGLLHDCGKYQESFQKRISGSDIRVEHSTCGAIIVKDMSENKSRYPLGILSRMMEYCIAGHHSGIPDGGTTNDYETDPTLTGRLKRKFEDFSTYKEELEIPELDEKDFLQFLLSDCDNSEEKVLDKITFLTRYLFSCLVDADSEDTANFCRVGERPRELKGNFGVALENVNQRLESFQVETELQKARALLQSQAFENAKTTAEIYLLNMPTGSGKTLASVKIALERVILQKKKRIIYVIPYNSIIDQTAEVFNELFQNNLEILRHQSTFDYENIDEMDEDYKEAAKIAIENWGNTKFIITTTVQFFESIYSNKRGKLRKIHNMADSILIFDEAHMMPEKYLQPCLQAVAYITKYLKSEAVFLTATMPDYLSLIRKYAVTDSKIINLIEDESLFKKFQKCNYNYLGEIGENELLAKSSLSPSSLIIVNTRKAARKLYKKISGKKYHLSTYMTALDRAIILKNIRKELKCLEKEFPDFKNVPEERQITIVSTSLIEAGVDLDVYTVFRELKGLDNILQAGGRCNREGKRKRADVFVFELLDSKKKAISVEMDITRDLLKKYEDISDSACIKEYYERIFSLKEDSISQNTMHCICDNFRYIPFKKYAENFELIDSRTVSLVVPRDEKSRQMVADLKYKQTVDERKLQNYTCSLYKNELDDLIKQNVVDDFGTGIYCLTNLDYYDEELGLLFEASDYFL